MTATVSALSPRSHRAVEAPASIQPAVTPTSDSDALVTQHLPLVGYAVSETLRRVPAHIERDDLASAGYLALVQAARSFDPTREVPFASYANTRIRGAILDELRAMDWISRPTRDRIRRLHAVTETLTAELGRTPTVEELADTLGVSIREIVAIRQDATRSVIQLDVEAAAATVSDSNLSPEDQVLVRERLQHLVAGANVLPGKLRDVIVGLYFEDRSLTEIGETLGVTPSRVSQMRTQALNLLRDAVNAALDPDLAPEPSLNPGTAEKRRLAFYAAVAEQVAARGTHAARKQCDLAGRRSA